VDTIVIVVILIHEGRVSSGKLFRISSRVNKYEKQLLAMDEYMVSTRQVSDDLGVT
jgi:hypothetical protein